MLFIEFIKMVQKHLNLLCIKYIHSLLHVVSNTQIFTITGSYEYSIKKLHRILDKVKNSTKMNRFFEVPSKIQNRFTVL